MPPVAAAVLRVVQLVGAWVAAGVALLLLYALAYYMVRWVLGR